MGMADVAVAGPRSTPYRRSCPTIKPHEPSIQRTICTPMEALLSLSFENAFQLVGMDDVAAAGPPVNPVPAVPPLCPDFKNSQSNAHFAHQWGLYFHHT